MPVNGSDTPSTENPTELASFEAAISATKFGKFHLCLFLLLIPGSWTSTFEVTSMSYVFPAAECDLNLTIHDKGHLNGGAYFGMIVGALLWGFLSDTLGRKYVLVLTFLLDSVMVVISGFSQSLAMLLLLKFFGGFFASGTYTGFTSYILEFYASKYRSKVQMVRGIVVSVGTVVLPILGWIIMPLDITLNHRNFLVFHSWNIFLFACALPSFLSGVIFIFMPESPKFLMTVGRNHDALKIFQKIYSFNTGKPKEEFPVKSLVEETIERNEERKHGGFVTANRTKKQALREVCTIQFLNMFSIQSIRLWLPQIFQSISDYKRQNNETTASLCKMLKLINPPQSSKCQFNVSSSVYFSTMIIASVSITNYIIVVLLINKLGKKILIFGSCLLGGICASSLYFAQTTTAVLILSSLFISMGGISLNAATVVTADLFPTTLRSVTISFTMVSGRLAAMLGNVIFPFLLKAGCAPPFLVVGSLIIVGSGLSILLPNTELKALQ
ncbi:synaptic vesicle glycoprotein 2C-like isoform X2 [Tribolium madens]|uniref:synaptic vesicle glycoprotein 2C-like isoform X2 n=1 Tax=Tribolium madens TaxID=41895 RepID=UPI001CF7641C|nr:synaptic vesicle glycoprotein 2C-like isoform X2 [Tribolium madens]